MKKIFTLLFAVGFLTAVYAQPGSRDNQQYDQRSTQQNGQWDNQRYDQRNAQQNGQSDNYSGYGNDRDITRNNDRYDNGDRYNNSNGFYGRGMEMQIARINRKYDFQVQQVRNDFFMRRYEKMRVINSLEVQRHQEIRMLYARTNRDWHHDRGYDSNRRY